MPGILSSYDQILLLGEHAIRGNRRFCNAVPPVAAYQPSTEVLQSAYHIIRDLHVRDAHRARPAVGDREEPVLFVVRRSAAVYVHLARHCGGEYHVPVQCVVRRIAVGDRRPHIVFNAHALLIEIRSGVVNAYIDCVRAAAVNSDTGRVVVSDGGVFDDQISAVGVVEDAVIDEAVNGSVFNEDFQIGGVEGDNSKYRTKV